LCIIRSLVIEDFAYEAKAKAKTFFLKAKAKDMKIVQGQHQGQLSQLPLRAKICIAVTEIYDYLIKHNAKELICGDFDVQC